MKVGLIRGAYLSQFEMQTYEHLLGRAELETYLIRINRFPTNLIRVPIKRLNCIDDPVTLVSPKLGFYFDLFLQATNGMDYFHFGLEKALAGKDIAHTMETFNAFSWQALRAKQRYGTKLVVTVWENRPYAAERFAAKRRMKYEVLHGADLFFGDDAAGGTLSGTGRRGPGEDPRLAARDRYRALPATPETAGMAA